MESRQGTAARWPLPRCQLALRPFAWPLFFPPPAFPLQGTGRCRAPFVTFLRVQYYVDNGRVIR